MISQWENASHCRSQHFNLVHSHINLFIYSLYPDAAAVRFYFITLCFFQVHSFIHSFIPAFLFFFYFLFLVLFTSLFLENGSKCRRQNIARWVSDIVPQGWWFIEVHRSLSDGFLTRRRGSDYFMISNCEYKKFILLLFSP